MQAIHKNPFQLIDTNGLHEALMVFESYDGPERYAPNLELIRSIKKLLIERWNKHLSDTMVFVHEDSHLELNHSKNDMKMNRAGNLNIPQQHVEEVSHNAWVQQNRGEERTPENQQIYQNPQKDGTTLVDDCDIVIKSDNITPNANEMVQRNSSGGRAWLSSTKAPRSRRKKSYTNRKKKPRNVSFGAIESYSHGEIPSSITIDRHGVDDGSFVFHSQSSMTDDF
jgi:hypothetical protein